MILRFYFVVFLLLTAIPDKCFSQYTLDKEDFFVIDSISISGNNRTKDKIILRELNFQVGDSISVYDTDEIIRLNENRIFNTGLFVWVSLTFQGEQRKIAVVAVKERYYTYPVPIIDLADRNFTEWWELRNHDLRRLNLGIFFIQKNLRGRNDELKIKLQGGFSQKYEGFYNIPYIDKKQKTGITFAVSYILNRQIYYKTQGHILQFYEDPDLIRKRFSGGVTFVRRNNFYERHSAGIFFFRNHVNDTITELNPRYFLNGENLQHYFLLRYNFISDHRDIQYYPLKGYYFKTEIEKAGVFKSDNVNIFSLRLEYSIYKPLSEKIFFSAGVKNKISFPVYQPYFNQRGLGYDKEFVSGYELYVIDGQHFGLMKLNLKYQLFSTIRHIRLIPLKQFQDVPFRMFFKIHSDAGYVRDNTFNPENNFLSNKLLFGGGAGFDFVSYYDFVMRVEMSVTREGRTGIFINFKSAI